jgi:AcrR family transcriptional regulator
MDDVIAESGMSSSAVYRYFRSKDELIDASAEEGMTTARGVFEHALKQVPLPSPRELIHSLVDALHRRAEHDQFDMTRLAMQTWAEAVRSPHLQLRAETLYGESLVSIQAILRAWQIRGEMSSDIDVGAAAYVLSSLLHGLIVNHHLLRPIDASSVISGLQALGLFLDLDAKVDNIQGGSG